MTGIEHADDPLVSGSLTSHDDPDALRRRRLRNRRHGRDGVGEARRSRAVAQSAFGRGRRVRRTVLPACRGARGFALRCATDAGGGGGHRRRGVLPGSCRRSAAVRGRRTTCAATCSPWSAGSPGSGALRRRDVPVADEELEPPGRPGRTIAAGSPPSAQLIARAFTSLPQRWRAVLWQVEVEGERPAVVAPHFGLSPNATAALARRARQGLRAAYLQAHLAADRGATGCRSVMDKLGAYTAGQVKRLGGRADHGAPGRLLLLPRAARRVADVCAGLRALRGSCRGRLLARSARARRSARAAAWPGHAGPPSAARIKLAGRRVSVAAVGGRGHRGPARAAAWHADAAPDLDSDDTRSSLTAPCTSDADPVGRAARSGAFEHGARAARTAPRSGTPGAGRRAGHHDRGRQTVVLTAAAPRRPDARATARPGLPTRPRAARPAGAEHSRHPARRAGDHLAGPSHAGPAELGPVEPDAIRRRRPPRRPLPPRPGRDHPDRRPRSRSPAGPEPGTTPGWPYRATLVISTLSQQTVATRRGRRFHPCQRTRGTVGTVGDRYVDPYERSREMIQEADMTRSWCAARTAGCGPCAVRWSGRTGHGRRLRARVSRGLRARHRDDRAGHAARGRSFVWTPGRWSYPGLAAAGPAALLLFFPVRWLLRRPWTLVAEPPGRPGRAAAERWVGTVRGMFRVRRADREGRHETSRATRCRRSTGRCTRSSESRRSATGARLVWVPELPEVEALAQHLREHAVGRTVAQGRRRVADRAQDRHPAVDRAARPRGVRRGPARQVPRRRIVPKVPLHLVVHLARAGWLRWAEHLSAAPPKPGKGPLALRVHLGPPGGPGLRPHRGRHEEGPRRVDRRGSAGGARHRARSARTRWR